MMLPKKGIQSSIVVKSRKCGSAWCVHCAHVYYARKKRRIVSALQKLDSVSMGFVKPRLLTLTVPRSCEHYSNAEGAFDYVNSNNLIKRFLENFGFNKKAFKVLEFHKSGWPHWHIIVDLADAEVKSKKVVRGKRWVPLLRMQRLWSSFFGVSTQVDLPLNMPKASVYKCLNYAISYVMKSGGRVPEWVTKRSRVRTYECYGDLRKAYSISADAEKDDKFDYDEDDDLDDLVSEVKKKRKARIIKDIVGSCGTTSVVLVQNMDIATGKLSYQYLDSLECSLSWLVGFPNTASDYKKPFVPPGYYADIVGADDSIYVDGVPDRESIIFYCDVNNSAVPFDVLENEWNRIKMSMVVSGIIDDRGVPFARKCSSCMCSE